MKRQTTEQEKMFVNHSSDTALISKINKELIQLNSKKKKKANIQLKNGQRTEYLFHQKRHTRELPGGPLVRPLHLHCREHGFNPWAGNQYPACHMAQQTNEKRHTNGQHIYEKGLNTTNHRGMQIKTMRYLFTPIRITTTKHKMTTLARNIKGRKRGILVCCWWKRKLVQPLWKAVWRFLRKLKIELPYEQQSHL